MMHAIKTAAVFAAFILQIRAAPAPQGNFFLISHDFTQQIVIDNLSFYQLLDRVLF